MASGAYSQEGVFDSNHKIFVQASDYYYFTGDPEQPVNQILGDLDRFNKPMTFADFFDLSCDRHHYMMVKAYSSKATTARFSHNWSIERFEVFNPTVSMRSQGVSGDLVYGRKTSKIPLGLKGIDFPMAKGINHVVIKSKCSNVHSPIAQLGSLTGIYRNILKFTFLSAMLITASMVIGIIGVVAFFSTGRVMFLGIALYLFATGVFYFFTVGGKYFLPESLQAIPTVQFILLFGTKIVMGLVLLFSDMFELWKYKKHIYPVFILGAITYIGNLVGPWLEFSLMGAVIAFFYFLGVIGWQLWRKNTIAQIFVITTLPFSLTLFYTFASYLAVLPYTSHSFLLLGALAIFEMIAICATVGAKMKIEFERHQNRLLEIKKDDLYKEYQSLLHNKPNHLGDQYEISGKPREELFEVYCQNNSIELVVVGLRPETSLPISMMTTSIYGMLYARSSLIDDPEHMVLSLESILNSVYTSLRRADPKMARQDLLLIGRTKGKVHWHSSRGIRSLGEQPSGPLIFSFT